MTRKGALAGKTIVMTGATDGIGRVVAERLAAGGARVGIVARDAHKGRRLTKILGGGTLFLADLASLSQIARVAAEIADAFSAIDVLINNAGLGYMAVVEEMKMEDFRNQFETNVFGVLRVTQAVLPHMRERRSGRILMISSVAGLVSPPTYGAYSSSKHALEGLSNSLRLELYPFGIEVVLIEPGYIVTNFQQTATALAKPYVDASKSSPYAKVYSGAWVGANKGRGDSRTTPEDCARVMLRAIEARSPKPRYGVTPLARLVKFGKRFLSDKSMDAILRSKYGITRDL